MKKIALLFVFAVAIAGKGFSQVYMTRTASVGFYGKTSVENISAEQQQAYAAIDLGKKTVAFSLLMKSFRFERALMQEHFNENYVESDKFPKATFTGTYTENVPADKPGTYNVTVSGSLTLHGVTQPVKVPATIQVAAGQLTGEARFNVKPEQFNISIPSVVRDKIAQSMEVHIKADFTPVKS